MRPCALWPGEFIRIRAKSRRQDLCIESRAIAVGKLKAQECALRMREKKETKNEKREKLKIKKCVEYLRSYKKYLFCKKRKSTRAEIERWKKSRRFQNHRRQKEEAWKVYQSSSAWKFKIVNELMIAMSRNILRLRRVSVNCRDLFLCKCYTIYKRAASKVIMKIVFLTCMYTSH